MKRLITLLCCALLFSCQDKVICPAFQSTFILDDSTRNAYFSYVWQLDESTRSEYLAKLRSGDSSDDSLGTVKQPKTDYYAYAGEYVVPWRIQKKTKYGIIKKVPYPIRKYRLRTAPMENVYGPEIVSNEFVAAEFDSLAVDSLSIALDSLALDSANVISTPAVAQEKKGPKFLYGYDPSDNFNVEQEYYNKYFSQRLIDNRPEPKPAPVDTTGVLPDSVEVKEPFFKGLFKKKKKTEEEGIVDEAVDEETIPEEIPEEEGENGGNGG